MNNRLAIVVLTSIMFATLAGCGPTNQTQTEAPIESGSFITVYTSTVSPDKWDATQNVTADVDRVSETVVFTLPDSTKLSLKITARPKDQWRGDCATMDSVVLSEIASISPAPVTLAGLTFTTPALYAKCGPDRLVLVESNSIDTGAFVAFDRVP
jgi:hypothetical protein